jgi:hypothetical protein
MCHPLLRYRFAAITALLFAIADLGAFERLDAIGAASAA